MLVVWLLGGWAGVLEPFQLKVCRMAPLPPGPRRGWAVLEVDFRWVALMMRRLEKYWMPHRPIRERIRYFGIYLDLDGISSESSVEGLCREEDYIRV